MNNQVCFLHRHLAEVRHECNARCGHLIFVKEYSAFTWRGSQRECSQSRPLLELLLDILHPKTVCCFVTSLHWGKLNIILLLLYPDLLHTIWSFIIRRSICFCCITPLVLGYWLLRQEALFFELAVSTRLDLNTLKLCTSLVPHLSCAAGLVTESKYWINEHNAPCESLVLQLGKQMLKIMQAVILLIFAV